MADNDRFSLTSETIGCLPVVNWFLSRIGLADILERYLPHADARLRLAPATVIGLVVRNLVCSHRPLYALGEWAAPFGPRCSDCNPAIYGRSTTTGWAACSTASSTPTGRA